MNRFKQVKNQIHAGSCRFVLGRRRCCQLCGEWPRSDDRDLEVEPPEILRRFAKVRTLVIPIADGIHDYAEDLTRADGSLAKHEIMRSTTTGSSTRRLTGRPVKRSTKS
jgi:hypothetical protein